MQIIAQISSGFQFSNPSPEELFNFLEFGVPGQLQDFIRSFFYMEVTDSYFGLNSSTTSYERVIPFGCIDLIIQSEPSFYIKNPKTGLDEQLPLVFLTPLLTGPIFIRPLKMTKIYGIRIQPWANALFLGKDAHQKAGTPTNSSPIIQILEQIHSSFFHGSHESSLEIIIKTLETFFKEREAPDMDVSFIVKRIISSAGDLQFEDVHKHSGLTQRRIEQKFLQQVGMQQKLFARIVRFQNVFQALNKDHNQLFTKVVYECGFYDQAHFIRNFKEFTGLTPKQYYYKERHLLSDVFLKPGTNVFLLNSFGSAA